MGSIRQFRPGRSPFDDIVNIEEDGTEWWSARELMPYLGYQRWESMMAVIERARLSCRNSGQDPASIFRDVTKYSEVLRRPGFDVQMLRLGCYLVALNGDPNKPEIAAAQRYFAVMTRAAETQAVLPPLVTVSIRPWSERFRETVQPHMRFMYENHPGCFTVVTTLVGQMLSLEDELIRHMLKPSPSDRPDISIGLCWGNERRARGLPPVDRDAPLRLPDQERDVYLCVYDDSERGTFEAWFGRVYLPEKLPNYLIEKKTFRQHGELPPASAADHACRGLTGQPARLRAPMRKQLEAVGGFAPVGTKAPALTGGQRSLFDDLE